MFALKSEIVIRVTLIVVMLFSALAPTAAAKAASLSEETELKTAASAPVRFGRVLGRAGGNSQKGNISSQADSPTETPTSIPSATPSPEGEATITPEIQETPTEQLLTETPIAPLSSADSLVSPEQAGTVTADSVWGASFPQNGANVLLFDSPYPDLFTGRASYSLPIWTPPGRNGMAPSLALSYSSNTANGALGDIQAPWVGMGWNLDSIEIARKITNGNCNPCGNGQYGYENKFLLLLNGTGYELLPDGATPGRYHTKIESFLYIQRHNDDLGNNIPPAANASGEWWEVVQRDGTRFRLGWNADSEQLAAMAGYPGAASGTWASLGYAGHATDVVALRWRVDLVADTHGNRMSFAYFEENRPVAGTTANYDRASYVDTITYTSHTSGNPNPGYSVLFVRESRAGSDIPLSPTDWDNWDTFRLDRIEVKYGANVERTYDLGYAVRNYSDDGVSWETTVLTSVSVSGGSTSAPAVTFTYTDKDNRANCGLGCQEWAYPRLASVSSGWGGTATYTYGNDGRPSTSWYNWRVEAVEVADGLNPSPMKANLAYSTPCYNDPSAGWCNASSVGELVGYGQVTGTAKDFDGTTTLAISVHKFHTDEQKAGREYEIQNQNAAGTTLGQTSVTYTVSTSGLPAGGFFAYASAVESFLRAASLDRVSRLEYVYDTTTGNPTQVKEFDGVPTLYRQTDYEYVTNTSPSVWILNTLSRRTLKDALLATIAKQEYGYDGALPGSGSPTLGELTLSRRVDGTQTIDTQYVYDTYGSLTTMRLYKSYGATGSQPTGAYLTYSMVYDTALKTYPTSGTNPLGHTAQAGYDYGQGLPTTVTDPNNNTTTTAYDGLGRPIEVTYPGYGQPNVKYTYPTPPVSAPFAFKAETLDESVTPAVYRSAWQVMDGLGRVIQTQGPYEIAGYLRLTDTSYNALGLTLSTGLPRALSGVGGSHFAPSWGSIPHTTTSYDALGRAVSVQYPDASLQSISYSGLRTTTIDRNNHQKVRERDAFGRLVKVEEYKGSGTYTLYATTTYAYDPRNLLKQITDAQSSQITMNYDGFGRKISMSDPDMGNWTYTNYDVFGNLGLQTDGRGCTATVTYDDLNRPLQKTFAGPGACATTPAVTYTYDSVIANNQGIGRRTGMSDGSGSTTWFYNRLGQPTNETRNIDSTNYPIDYTFDAFNRPLTQTLPSGETLNYGYNAMGALSSLSGTSTYVSQIHYSASGQVTDQQLGNGLLQQYCYETNTLRLSAIRAYSGALQGCGTNPPSPKLNLSYTYQPNGDVSQMTDATQNETTTYTYDELDRLLSVSGPNNKNYAYNPSGNISSVTTTPTLIAVEAGYDHTCALTASGGVKCWGDNGGGQLGDGTTIDRNIPVDVSGLTSGVSAIAAGGGHTCALTTSGGVKCWGGNGYGQLGDGTTTTRTAPVDVSGLTSGVAAITAGSGHTCALTTGGGVKCWGNNANGQLGNNSTINSSTPVDVDGLSSGVAAITAGGGHTCALTTGGGVKCWGENTNGQVGDGTQRDRKRPVDVSGLSSGVAAITAGKSHTCALTTSGGAKCWGWNLSGQLGDGTGNTRLTPVDVSGLTSGVAAITAGSDHTCAVTTSGGAKCWGHNGYGRLGDGTITDRSTPVDVSGLTSGMTAIAAGGYHTCALTTSGGVKCWGDNRSGQLGDGKPITHVAPADVSGLSSGAAAITAGSRHTCALTSGGGARCWGDNTFGQIGDGTQLNRATPVNVTGLASGVAAITAGYDHTCALTSSGGVKCWGWNLYGQLGDGTQTSSTTPVDVSGLSNGVTAIAAARYHTCALTTGGGVKCWGFNGNGELGNGSQTNSATPVDVSGLSSGVVAIAAGHQHTCALLNTGAVKCWGLNASGQLGNGTQTSSTTPVDVSGLSSGVTAIAAGGYHTCAVTTSGGLKCWGENADSQLGNGTQTSSTTPVDVSGLTSGVSAVTAGNWHTCALTTSGGVKCWGWNGYGQLGDGTQTSRATPVNVSGLTSGMSAVDAGGWHTCALTTGGGAKCWGDSTRGQVGDGSIEYSIVPVSTDFGALNSYSYDDHAVTGLSSGETYTYDANGNMITRVEGGLTYTQTFDAENRLISITVSGQTTQFVYDGDGNLVKKIKPDGSRTIYIGNVYEVDKSSGGAVTRTVTYYPAGGAMRIDGNVYYVLKDRLGSAYATTDASGNVLGEMRYYAFGETRLSTGTMFTDRLYTGQRQIAELGIYHYNARFYSPKLGRFLSADTLMSGFANPQSLNRFSYTANNPVRYTDPTGRCWIELSSHMVWFSDSDPKCGGSYTPTNDGGGEITPNDKPEGLDPTGTDAYNGLMTLNSMSGWWNADGSFYVEEALAMLLWAEAGVTVGYSYDTGGNQVFSYPQPVMTAITAKWQQNCSGGWNTASCLNDFWGYYQAITDIPTDTDLQQVYLTHNLEDTVATYGGDVHTTAAGNIMTAPTILVTSTTPTGWATVGTQSAVGQALGGNASYQYTYPSGDAVFFVVSSQQQDAICKKVGQGPGCNLSNLAP